jgi:hypothetical protein
LKGGERESVILMSFLKYLGDFCGDQGFCEGLKDRYREQGNVIFSPEREDSRREGALE